MVLEVSSPLDLDLLWLQRVLRWGLAMCGASQLKLPVMVVPFSFWFISVWSFFSLTRCWWRS
ncbi:Uncharacterised protein [Vibrio cholerae]|nr:Uncharacterised protein [Vibrio cholerae]